MRACSGRAADEGGLRHYVGAIAAGDRRSQVVRALGMSEEFDRRHHDLAPQSGVLLRDIQLCELANPAKWDNEEWLDILRSLGLSDDKLSMHRKPYEFTQLLFGCRRLGALREDSSVISVGAGHELVLYWLANHVRRVIATDMYEGVWQDVQGREGDPDVINRPDEYAPFPYRRDHLTFMKMDGRQLAFRDGTFDIAYSLSSIEHFGGVDGAAATIREMGRVLKPGGILALATEYVLGGPPHEETFLPQQIASLVDQPGLELVQPIDEARLPTIRARRDRSVPQSLPDAPHGRALQRHRLHDRDGLPAEALTASAISRRILELARRRSRRHEHPLFAPFAG